MVTTVTIWFTDRTSATIEKVTDIDVSDNFLSLSLTANTTMVFNFQYIHHYMWQWDEKEEND